MLQTDPHLEKRVHVAICGDRNVLMPMAVTVASIALNIEPGKHCTLHLLTPGFTQKERRRIEAFHAGGADVEINWIDVNDDMLSAVPKLGRYPLASYYRLVLPELLPDDVQQVVYFDTDVLVCRSVSELASVDLKGAIVGAVTANTSPWLASSPGLSQWRELNLDPNLPYFNAGVLLLNIRKWKSENLTGQVMDFLADQSEAPRFADQDALNAILCNRWRALDPAWNVYTTIFEDWGLDHCLLNRSEVDRIREDPWVIHYTGREKPWRSPDSHPLARSWYEVLEATDWRGFRPPAKSRLLPTIRRLRKLIQSLEARLESDM